MLDSKLQNRKGKQRALILQNALLPIENGLFLKMGAEKGLHYTNNLH